MQSVKNALLVLETIAQNQPAGLSELAQRLDLPKTTVQRCITTLHEAGWIRPSGHELRRWSVSGKAFAVGSQAAQDRDLRSVAMPVLSALQEAADETVHLMVPDGDHVVLIERLDCAHELRTFSMLGSRSPMHATANGKAILAALPRERVDEYLTHHLAKVTDKTVVDPDVLLAQLDRIRSVGYAVNEEELRKGVVSLGAAIVVPGAGPVASLSVSGPKTRLTSRRLPVVGDQVRRAADEIGQRLRGA